MNTKEVTKPNNNNLPMPTSHAFLQDSIFIKWKQQYRKIPLINILWIAADGNYSHIITAQRKYAPTIQLRYLYKKLNCAHLIRVHRSFVVNIHQVTRFEEHRLFIGEKSIPISKSYRADFLSLIRMI